jgi:hypothetical protein
MPLAFYNTLTGTYVFTKYITFYVYDAWKNKREGVQMGLGNRDLRELGLYMHPSDPAFYFLNLPGLGFLDLVRVSSNIPLEFCRHYHQNGKTRLDQRTVELSEGSGIWEYQTMPAPGTHMQLATIETDKTIATCMSTMSKSSEDVDSGSCRLFILEVPLEPDSVIAVSTTKHLFLSGYRVARPDRTRPCIVTVPMDQRIPLIVECVGRRKHYLIPRIEVRVWVLENAQLDRIARANFTEMFNNKVLDEIVEELSVEKEQGCLKLNAYGLGEAILDLDYAFAKEAAEASRQAAIADEVKSQEVDAASPAPVPEALADDEAVEMKPVKKKKKKKKSTEPSQYAQSKVRARAAYEKRVQAAGGAVPKSQDQNELDDEARELLGGMDPTEADHVWARKKVGQTDQEILEEYEEMLGFGKFNNLTGDLTCDEVDKVREKLCATEERRAVMRKHPELEAFLNQCKQVAETQEEAKVHTAFFDGLAKYKSRAEEGDEGKDKNLIGKKLDAEQSAWESSRENIDTDSANWMKKLQDTFATRIDIDEFVQDCRERDEDPLQSAKLMDHLYGVIARERRINWHEEGVPINGMTGPRIDDRLLNLEKAPSKSIPPMKLLGLQLKRVENLLKRQVLTGILHPIDSKDYKPGGVCKFFIHLLSNVFSAHRKGTETGRLVVNYKVLNLMARLIAVPPSLTATTHELLMRDGIKFYTELDIANAFHALVVDFSLATWAALQVPSAGFFPLRGSLGLTFMPAIFNQLTYPSILKMQVSPGAIKAFWNDLKAAVAVDERDFPGLASTVLQERVTKYIEEEAKSLAAKAKVPTTVPDGIFSERACKAATPDAEADVKSVTEKIPTSPKAYGARAQKNFEGNKKACNAELVAPAKGSISSGLPEEYKIVGGDPHNIGDLEHRLDELLQDPETFVKDPLSGIRNVTDKIDELPPVEERFNHKAPRLEDDEGLWKASGIHPDRDKGRVSQVFLKYTQEYVDTIDPAGNRRFCRPLVDDIAYGSESVPENGLQFLMVLEAMKNLNLQLSLRKYEGLRKRIQSLAYEFESGKRIVTTKKLHVVKSWDAVPASPEELASLLGFTVYISSAWGLDYSRISSILRPFTMMTKRQYEKEIWNSPLALQALIDLRECASETELEPLPVCEIQRGERLLLIFVDSCGFGTGFTVVTIPRTVYKKLNSENILEHTQDFKVHHVCSTPFPSNLRWFLSAEAEIYGLRHYRKTYDDLLRGLPRTVILDHLNLSDLDREIHRQSNIAFWAWTSDLEVWIASNPGLRLMYGGGELQESLSDLFSRYNHHIRIARAENELAIAGSYKSVLEMLAPKPYKYDSEVSPPLCAQDTKRTARKQDSKIMLKALVEKQLTKLITDNPGEFAKIKEQMGFLEAPVRVCV